MGEGVRKGTPSIAWPTSSGQFTSAGGSPFKQSDNTKKQTQTTPIIHELGLAIRPSLMKSIPNLLVGINECLMKLCFRLNKSHHVSIINAYTPTLTSPDEVKEQSYKNLDQLIRSTPAIDKVLIHR